MTERVYLDYGAATPVRHEVLEEMARVSDLSWANSSALYEEARMSKDLLNAARERIAKVLQVKASHVFFTSGSTESNNLVILGRAKKLEKGLPAQAGEMVSTLIEHSSISAPLRELEQWGWKINLAPVDSDGKIDTQDLTSLVTNKTALVSYAWANTDIGTLQPIADISRAVKEINENTLIHIDASQAGTTLLLANACQHASFVTISPSKMYGPKGIGILVAKDPRGLSPIIRGGEQEQALRAGTEYVSAACGAAVALELAQKDYKKEAERLGALRDFLIEELKKVEGVIITGSQKDRLANHVSCAVEDADGEEIVVRLDEKGFSVGTGSACTTQGGEISEAVKALNIPEKYQTGTVRVTLGTETQKSHLESFLVSFKDVVSFIHGN